MAMTTPRDDIAGLSEELRLYAKTEMPFPPDDICSKAATQLDALLKERDALQARVKELEEGWDVYDTHTRLWKIEHDRKLEAAEAHALRAEQERDEAYERLKPFADAAEKLDDVADALRCNDEEPIGDVMWPDDQPTAGNIRAARDLVLRLAAGPEKETK